MQHRPSAPPQRAVAPADAPNPVLVLSDDGADLAAAFADAGFATRITRSPAELDSALGGGLRDMATPPLVVVDLRNGGSADSVHALRQRDGRLPILAIADDPARASAAADAGANATVGSDELGPRLAELVNLLLRMATLW